MGVFWRTSRPAATSKKVSFCHIKEQVGQFRWQHMRAELPGGKHLEEEWCLFTRAHHMLYMLLQLSATDEFKMIWQLSSCPVHNEALWFQQFLTVLNNFRDTQATFRRRCTVSEYNHDSVVIICLQTQNSSKRLTYKEVCLCVKAKHKTHLCLCLLAPSIVSCAWGSSLHLDHALDGFSANSI